MAMRPIPVGSEGVTDRPTMPILTDEEDIRDLLSKTTRIHRGSYDYYREHHESLQESHGGEIVAIVDNQVVDSIEYPAETEDLREFVERVRDEYGEKVYMTHILKPDQTLIL